MGDKMHIAFCTDKHYASYTGVAMTSIILNNLGNAIFFHLFHIGLNEDDKNKFILIQKMYMNVEIKFYDLSSESRIDSMKINHYYTKAVYLRWYIAEKIDLQVKRILYLDGDILCLGDLKELYYLKLPSDRKYALAAVGKSQTENEIKRLKLTQPKVINTGVLLIDLFEWRQQKISARLFEYAEKHHDELIWLDNDVMNSVLDGDFYLIEEKWNHRIYINNMPHFCILPNDIIVHYSGKYKPWSHDCNNKNAFIWWEYVKKSLWNNITKA